MKTPQFSFLFAASAIIAATSFACSGGGGTTPGTTGSGGSGALTDCEMVPTDQVISNFEEGTVAAVSQNAGRNGYWYSYNDMATTCAQTPMVGAAYVPSTIAGGGRCLQSAFALETKGMGCATWGAGIGADLAQPVVEAGTYMGKKVRYDITPYATLVFWARTESGKAIDLRVKLPMTDETKTVDGGDCDEAVVGTNMCSDDFGKAVALTANWKKYTIKLDTAPNGDLAQEGWGAKFTWDKTHVTSIQLQNKASDDFDFWVDDFSFGK
jgi:hypothetical protein